jgi:lipoprotein-anchoring transpeptidase ErfK/SrfK
VLAAIAGFAAVGMANAANPAPPSPTNTALSAPAAPVPDVLGRAAADPVAHAAPATVRPARGSDRDPAADRADPAPDRAADPAAQPATAAPRSASPARARVTDPAAGTSPKVDGTPCTAAARACVDLAGRKAWLIEDGRVARGPEQVMTGDRDDPTPRGTFTVQWKAEQYTSREYLTQMPYSVFFADGGIAFHEGSQETYSAGCVKLDHEDAVAFFTYLQVGDRVQVR